MPNDQLIQDLKATRANVERGWEQSVFARKADGKACESVNPEACSFCLAGAAINATKDELPSETRWYDIGRALEAVIGESLIHFNDTENRTKEEILAAIDATIAAAQASS